MMEIFSDKPKSLKGKNSQISIKILNEYFVNFTALGRIHVLFHFIIAILLLICIFALHINIQDKYKKAYPELEIQPSLEGSSKVVLIRYDDGNAITVDKWVNLINNFLEGEKIKWQYIKYQECAI